MVQELTGQSSPLLLTHASQLLTLRGENAARRGAQMRELGIIADGAVLFENGKIVAVGTTDELRTHELAKTSEEIDCRGKVVLPGFVDSHTHPVFANPRLIDFEKRIAGAGYAEIAEAGGGIRSSIRGVRESSAEDLAQHVLKALNEMAAHGTTTVEAKSGYGLDLASELKSLEAIQKAAQQWPGTVVATLLGAHVVPPEFHADLDEYVRIVCEEMIPAVAHRKLADYALQFLDPARAGVLIRGTQPGTQQVIPAENVQRQIAVVAVIAVEEGRPSSGIHYDFTPQLCPRGRPFSTTNHFVVFTSCEKSVLVALLRKTHFHGLAT